METETKQLRVKPFLPPPEKQKISFRLPAPTVSTFNSYLEAYAEIYGVSADPDFVAEQIFTTFFESDRAFAAYLKKGAEPEEAETQKRKKTALGGEGATLGETAHL